MRTWRDSDGYNVISRGMTSRHMMPIYGVARCEFDHVGLKHVTMGRSRQRI